jgi:tetratricopeptide (TPR) repeat protein
MPRPEDIEKFTQVLNSLGDEPAIRAARSETIEQVSAPGEETPEPEGEPLDSLPLDSLSMEEEEPPGGQAGPGPAPEDARSTVENGAGLQDVFGGLSGLTEEPDLGAGPTGEPAIGEQPFEEPSAGEPAAESGDGLDFASLFAEETEPNAIEDLETPPPEKTPSAAELPEEDAFTFPEGEPEGLQADISQMEVVPEDTEQPSGLSGGPAGASGAPEAGAESFEDFGAFSLDAPETAEPEPPQPAGSAESFDENIDLPNLDELSFGEPSAEPAATAEPSFEVPESIEPPEQAFGVPEPQEPSEPVFEVPESEGLSDIPSAGGFDLDTATGFETPEPGAEPFEASTYPEEPAQPPAAAPEGEAELPGMESLGEESLGDLNLDEFNLPESAEQFGAPGLAPIAPAAPAREAPARPAPRPRPAARPSAARPAPRELPGAEGEVELSPEQFARLKKALESLPRNLKIAVQDLIGQGKAAGADLSKLIALLLANASAQEIATLAGRISGKRIRIPAGYEKKTGVAFEAEQRTFAYAFRENILPLVRVVLLTVLVGGALGFFGYSYVYKPLSAFTNYRAGYVQITNDRFTLANERFARAVSVWPMKAWFYRYAEGFADKRQYVLAEEKYDDLLRRFGDDRKGILDYARMESTRLADYEKADTLLKRLLDRTMYDYDALLATGDNDMEWGERVPAKFEAARLSYATLIEKYGVKDDLLFRMLRFFIRTDNGEEVERLRVYYASRPEVKVDPVAFAELGGYLVDHRRLDYAQDVLFRADKVKPGLAEVHYNLARYYRIVKSTSDEKLALDAVVKSLTNKDPLTRKRLSIEIDTYTREGELSYRSGDFVLAEKDLQRAISLVEQNQKMKLIGKERLFGRPYAALGDLYYYVQGDLANAGVQYQTAIANQFTDPGLSYKIGFIQYAGHDYKGALASFASTEDQSAYPSGNEELASAAPGETGASSAAPAVPAAPAPPLARVPQNLLFALGNCFFQRGDYFAAQGYFLGLLDRLELKKAGIGNLLPLEVPEHRALMDNLVKVNNNLGVTMIRLSERTGDRKKRSEALVYLTAAAQIADSLSRAPDTVLRNETRSVPSLNMQGILYPTSTFVLQIFQALPKDLQAQGL